MFYTISYRESDEHAIVRRSKSLAALQHHHGKLACADDPLVKVAQRIGFVLEDEPGTLPRVEVCSIDGEAAAEWEAVEPDDPPFTRQDEVQLGAIADYYDGVSRGQRD